MTRNDVGFVRDGGHGRPALRAQPLTPDFIYDPEADDLLDLRKIWSMILRHRALIFSIIAGALAIGVLSLFLMSPTYRATASLEIENQPTKVLGTEEFQPVNGGEEADRLLQTQIDILGSRELAEQVADGLNLAANNKFLRAENVRPKPEILREQVIDALRRNIVVSMPRNSRVVPVSFDSSDPVLSARIANSYSENLIAANLQRHFDSSKYSKNFLENQLTVTKAKLEDSERSLLDYARSVGIVDPSAGGGDPDSPGNNAPRSLTSANLIDINQSLAQARANRIQAEGRWHEAQATPLMSLPDVLSNPAIQQMSQKRAEMEADYEQQLQHRQPDHPALKQEAAAIKELDRQIGTLASGIRDSIKNQYQSAVAQESEMSRAVSQLKGATMAEQQLGIRYNILKREVETNRELYKGLLQRYKEVSAESGVTSNNISIVDRAVAPLLPIAPRPVVNLALALLAGLLIAAGAVTAIEMINNKIRSPEEIELEFGLALLGTVPRLRKGVTPQAALVDGRSPMSEAYETVRAGVELSRQGGMPRTLAVTSCREGEAKSTTAFALACDSASQGRKILLIDADMRRPSMHLLFGEENGIGLADILTNEAPIVASAIVKTQIEGLDLLPAGSCPPRPAALLSGNGLRALLGFLGKEYDQIIIDCPPILGLADAPHIAAIVDGTILVIESNRSDRGAILAATRRLIAAGANVIGSVLTKFDPKATNGASDYLLEAYSYAAEEGKPVAA